MSTLERPSVIDVEVPAELSARQPVEATPGAGRDAVRLMRSNGREPPRHHTMSDLPELLDPGDLLVVNTSAAMAAASDTSPLAMKLCMKSLVVAEGDSANASPSV